MDWTGLWNGVGIEKTSTCTYDHASTVITIEVLSHSAAKAKQCNSCLEYLDISTSGMFRGR